MPDEAPKTRQSRGRGIFFYADFNLDQVLRLANRLRGLPCTCDASQTPKAGAYNFAIVLAFEDGVEWIFRAPSSAHAPAKTITDRLLASEAATLKYVREHTTIPVPHVFHYRYPAPSPFPFPSDRCKHHVRQRHWDSIHPDEQGSRSSTSHVRLASTPAP